MLDQRVEDLEEFRMSLLNNKNLLGKFKLFMNIIDEKVLIVLTNTKSSQACLICEATPQIF